MRLYSCGSWSLLAVSMRLSRPCFLLPDPFPVEELAPDGCACQHTALSMFYVRYNRMTTEPRNQVILWLPHGQIASKIPSVRF